jgi:hypothetical protein
MGVSDGLGDYMASAHIAVAQKDVYDTGTAMKGPTIMEAERICCGRHELSRARQRQWRISTKCC